MGGAKGEGRKLIEGSGLGYGWLFADETSVAREPDRRNGYSEERSLYLDSPRRFDNS
ncbi:MAG: hypothetical protein Ct9H300mP15_22700 [Gemmatimonadota bacterium]|nr:MAG: hypothetical protein Ct9H300mP15_22700 [Gemmatimonadota bacterium]